MVSKANARAVRQNIRMYGNAFVVALKASPVVSDTTVPCLLALKTLEEVLV